MKSAEFFGSGAEWNVFSDPDHPTRLIKEKHGQHMETLAFLRGRFYLTKLLHLLYPQHIPDMYRIDFTPPRMIVERIALSEAEEKARQIKNLATTQNRFLTPADEAVLAQAYKEIPLEKAWDLINLFKKLGIEIDHMGDQNIANDHNHVLMYLDGVDPWFVESENMVRNYNHQKLAAAIQQLPPSQQDIANKYLEKIEYSFIVEDQQQTQQSKRSA